MTTLTRLFTDHPASVRESYFQHAGVAASFAYWLTLAAGAAAIHAVLPFLFEKTASRIIMDLHNRMLHR